MCYFVYDVVEGYVEKRIPFRNELLLVGSFAHPVDGTSPGVAERFPRSDPHGTHGLVTSRHVGEGSVVIGGEP